MPNYQYSEPTKAAIKRCLRGLFPPGISLQPASREEDFGGIDVHYVVDHSCPLQLRVRHNRPAPASDIDITFRTTEPPMMAAGTYAPLAVFMWEYDGEIVAAKLVDIYRMCDRICLIAQPCISNYDDTAFYSVTIAALHDARALLRIYDGSVWATAVLGGEARLNQILRERRAAS